MMIVTEIPDLSNGIKINQLEANNDTGILSPFLNKIEDTKSAEGIAFYRAPAPENTEGLFTRIKSYFYPPASLEVIEIGDISESGAVLMRGASKAREHRDSFHFRPVVKITAAMLSAAATGAALGAYAYSRYTGTHTGTVVMPRQNQWQPPVAAEVIGGFNLFPKRVEVTDEDSVEAATLPPEVDGVTSTLLFDLSCLEVRNDMTFADGLRTVGTALSTPFDAMAKESQVVHFMNTKGVGCPDNKSIEEVEKYTKPIDNAVNTFMSATPGFQAVSVLQNVVGPLMQMAADDLQGKNLTPEEREKALIEIGESLDQVVFTLRPDERIYLYQESKENTKFMDIVAKRISFDDGKVHVIVDGKKYRLRETKKERIPFIENEDGDHSFIKYNQVSDKWERVEENSFPEDSGHYVEFRNNKEKLQKWGMPFDKKMPAGKIELLRDGKDNDLFLYHKPGDGDYKGVFIQNVFVPVEQVKIKGKWVTTTLSTDGIRAVLEDSVYGWTFEQKSTAMDKNTKILLNIREGTLGLHFTPGQRFTNIDNNGLCYDDNGDAYLKKDDLYYWIDKLSDGIKFHASPTSLIQRENGIFILKRDEDMLYSWDAPFVGNSDTRRGTNEDRHIEREALDYLGKYAAPELRGILSRYQLYSGIFEVSSSGSAFITDKGSYVVFGATPDHVTIERSGSAGGFIKLRMQGDTYIRERDSKFREKFNYKKVAICRARRSPEGACGGLPLMIETGLESKLNTFIAAGKSIDRAERNIHLHQDKMVPGGAIYTDSNTGKSYLMHKGNFFEAEVCKAGDPDNQANKNQDVYKIYAKGNFLTRREHIDTIIIEQEADKITIKPQSVYLAEQVNISSEMAQEYIKSRRYRYAGGLRDVEDAVNAVGASGKFFVAKIPKEYAPQFSDSAINTQIHAMYPSRITNDPDFEIKVFGLNDDPATLSDYQKGVQIFLKSTFKYIRQHLIPTVITATRYSTEDFNGDAVREYLTAYFKDPGDEFLDAFDHAYTNILKRMLAVIDPAKIKISTVVMKKDVAAALDFEGSEGMILTNEERRTGQVAFIAADEKSNIYLCADKMYAIPGVDFTPAADLISVLLHELSHAEGMTTDITYLPRTKDGKYISALDAVDHIIDKISKWELIQHEDFKKRSAEYIKNIPIYKNKLPRDITNKLSILASADPGFLGHITLNNADSVSMITQDIFEAAIYGISEMKPSNSIQHIRPENKYSGDEYGTIYNGIDGRLIKLYDSEPHNLKGTFVFLPGNQYLSRTDIALRNAECLNAIFGENSATVTTNPREYTASLRFKRIPGQPCTIILERLPYRGEVNYRKAVIDNMAGESPADILADKLLQNGVVVHDTSLRNLYFHKTKGFNFFSYDTADLYPDSSKIPQSEIDTMKVEIKSVIAIFAIRCGMNPDVVLKKLGLPVEQIPVSQKRSASGYLQKRERQATPKNASTTLPPVVFMARH